MHYIETVTMEKNYRLQEHPSHGQESLTQYLYRKKGEASPISAS